MGPTRLLTQDESLTREVERGQQSLQDKDDVELQLEKLLFGDEAGFLDALQRPHSVAENAVALRREDAEGNMESELDDEEMGDVPDEQLFFLDSGNGNVPHSIAQHDMLEDEGSDEEPRQPIWYDSDDEKLTVSLASNTRLRKLRISETDDVISGTEYIRRLRKQYERLHPTPEWVNFARKRRKVSHDSIYESDSDLDEEAGLPRTQPLAELLRSANSLTRTQTEDHSVLTGRKLKPEVIDIQRLKDIAGQGPSAIDTLAFHPRFPLIMSGGPSSTVNIYHVSPDTQTPNPLLTSLHVKGTPLHTAAFCSPNGDGEQQTQVILSSRRRYFHTWSLSTGIVSKVSRPVYGDGRHEQKTMELFKISPCGRYIGFIGSGKKGGGSVNVLSTETMQWICSCRIDSRGGITDFAWWSNGSGFAVVGKNGEVSEYEVDSKRTLVRWNDEGAVGTTVIAVGGKSKGDRLGESRWVAVGSSSGVVNVYDRDQWSTGANGESQQIPQRPKPTRVLTQLTTPISHLEFANDGQMLVMGSRWKKNALRLVHLPTCTVYRNWPTDKTPLGRISSIAMSFDGSYLAAANEQGKIRLWQIRS